MYSNNVPLLKPIFSALIYMVLAASTVCPSVAQAADDHRIKQLQNERNQLSRLTDPADRAETQMKIADILLTYVREAITAGDLQKLKSSLSEYQLNVTGARDTMMASGQDGYRKPRGYKAIELTMRAHLRILQDYSRQLDVGDRESLEEVIALVSEIRSEVLRALFS